MQKSDFNPTQFRRQSDRYGMTQVISEWSIIALLLYVSTLSYWLWPVVLLGLGRSQLILDNIGHYAAHGTLFRTRQLNTFFSFLYFYPVFTTLSEWKEEHERHHKYLGSPQDPGEQTYRRWKLYEKSLTCCILQVPISDFVVNLRLLRIWRNMKLVLFWIILIAVTAFTNSWNIFAVWIISFFTTRAYCICLSEIAEHWKSDGKHNHSKWITGSRIVGNIFLFKHSCDSYHWMHHEYPGISPNVLADAYNVYTQTRQAPQKQTAKQILAEII